MLDEHSNSDTESMSDNKPVKRAKTERKAFGFISVASITRMKPAVFSAEDSKEDIRKHFMDHGYVAVQVMTPEAANALKESTMDYLKRHIPGLSADSVSTLPDRVHGIIKSYGIGQCPAIWEARCNENVQKVFSAIHDKCRGSTELNPLLSSFDGAGLYWPVDAKDKLKPWGHIDQKPSDAFFKCGQGALNLTSSLAPGSSATMIWPGTHKRDWTEVTHTESAEEAKKVKKNWFKIPYALAGELPDPVILALPAGTLFVWDSRLVHANAPPTKQYAEEHGSGLDPLRACMYISMMPLECVKKDMRGKSDAAVEKMLWKRLGQVFNRRTTNHWVKGLVNSDAKRMRSTCIVPPEATMPLVRQTDMVVTAEMRRLIDGGVEPMTATEYQIEDERRDTTKALEKAKKTPRKRSKIVECPDSPEY